MEVPREILAAYGREASRVARIPGGLINETYRVDDDAVLQRLHPVFGAEVHHDIEAVTAQLAAAGMATPRLLPTAAGALWAVDDGGRVWRLQTYVDGITLHRVRAPADAEAAGALVARFHRALMELDHDYAFARAGVHDTAAHVAKLERLLPAADDEARALGDEVLADAESLELPRGLPLRHTHGDLKISNVLFARGEPVRGRCLIDLDTVGRQTMAYELGDALRSWCNPQGEDVPEPAIDVDVFRAALTGYGPGTLDDDEAASITGGLHTVCVELAARFCADAIEDRYFGWDPTRFPSRRAHNLVRARGQLALARSIAARRAELERIAARALME